MTLEERIQQCEICQLRKHTEEDWIVCSLTDALPDFEYLCPDFVEDPYEIQSKKEFSQETDVAIGEAPHHRRLEKLMAGGVYLGLLFIFFSIILGVVELLNFNGISKLPILLFFIGGVAIARDLLKKHL